MLLFGRSGAAANASAEIIAKPTSIPFGLPPELKTPHIFDNHYLDKKVMHCPAKRNLKPASAGSNENIENPPVPP